MVGKGWKRLEKVGNGWNMLEMVGSTQAEKRVQAERRACPKAMLQHLFSATSPRKNGQRPSVPMLGYGDLNLVTSGFRFLI